MDDQLDSIVATYSRFNAVRTLSTDSRSLFQAEVLGNCALLVDAARPSPGICNRVLGFGASDVSDLSTILSKYGEHRPRFDLRPDELCPSVVDSLLSVGYRPVGSLAYLLSDPKVADADEIRVERWGHDRADEFVRLLERAGVPYSDAIWAKRREHYCTCSFRTFVSYLEGRPAGLGTLYVTGQFGVLANAVTFPEYRGRGVHTALLRGRLSDAHQLGLDTLLTDVEPNSISYRNCLKVGFELTTIHSIWCHKSDVS